MWKPCAEVFKPKTAGSANPLPGRGAANRDARLLSAVTAIALGSTASLAQTPPTITTQPTNQTAFVGSTVTLVVVVTGTGPFDYQWQLNGTNIPSGIISTAAGNGTQGNFGDGGAAANASLGNPTGIATDSAGNLFIADAGNNRVRKVTAAGIITTVAGNGTQGYSGDGGSATAANLANPVGVTVDSAGNLFIADDWNNCVRKVDTRGIISTVAGNASQGYSGDGGPALDATFTAPAAVAVDGQGNLFIADGGNNRVRQVDTRGIITTVAGNGTPAYSGDGGAATNASLRYPGGLATDPAGTLFIADAGNNLIRQVDTNGVITTVAGNGLFGYFGDGGAATDANLANPIGVALDAAGDLFIADQFNGRIRAVDPEGIISTVAGNGTPGFSGDGGGATDASLTSPSAVALDASGDLFVADTGNN
ncbi:MAG: serine/threonine protein kinase, partial [Verrucomicrobia bacterium]|nr:serine/threonine protein kinase [Verrucomicrobiota bacterium]